MGEITYVTAFFKLRERENNPHIGQPGVASTEFYLQWADKLLQHPIYLIIFIDPSLEAEVQKIRNYYCLQDLTRIIPLSIEELPLYSQLTRFEENHQRNPVRNHNLQKYTPLYNLVINSKPDLLKKGIELDPFQTTHFAWIDFRIMDLCKPIDAAIFYRLEKTKKNKIRIPVMNYLYPEEYPDRREYYSYSRGKIAGGFLEGPKEEILLFIEDFQEELELALQAGYSPSEEQVYPLAVFRRDQYNFFYCDYGGSFTNFDYLKKDLRNAYWFLDGSYNRADHPNTYRVTKKILSSAKLGYLNEDPAFTPYNLFLAGYRHYISSYYLGKYDSSFQIAHLLLLSFADYLISPEMKEEISLIIRDKKPFLQENFQHLQERIPNYQEIQDLLDFKEIRKFSRKVSNFLEESLL